MNEVLITVTYFIRTDLSLNYARMEFLKTFSSFIINTPLLLVHYLDFFLRKV